mgnify:CR=1 FL=1
MTDNKVYFSNLTTLLKKEWQEDLQQYKDKILYTAIPEKKKSGVCWYPVVVNSHHIGTGEKIVLELEKTTDLEQAHMFQGGGTVSFYANTGEKDKGSSAITGVIKYVRKSKMGIVLNDDDLPEAGEASAGDGAQQCSGGRNGGEAGRGRHQCTSTRPPGQSNQQSNRK